MKVNNTQVEISNSKKPNLFLILAITIIIAIIFSGVMRFVWGAIVWLWKLIVEHRLKIVIGIAIILILKKILFRKKSKIQEMRIVQ